MVIKTYPLIYLIVPIIQTWTKLFFCIQYLCQRFLASKHMSCISFPTNQPRGVGQSVEISCQLDKICRSTNASCAESLYPKVCEKMALDNTFCPESLKSINFWRKRIWYPSFDGVRLCLADKRWQYEKWFIFL